jgi:hypothetical protein
MVNQKSAIQVEMKYQVTKMDTGKLFVIVVARNITLERHIAMFF